MAVARATTYAETQNPEWSSTPVTILASHSAGEDHAAHDVHLPQLHGPGTLPALVVAAALAPGLGSMRPCADQAAIDRRAARHGVDAVAPQLMADGAGAPAGMGPAQLEDGGLDLQAI
jgi:hypothetical protein